MKTQLIFFRKESKQKRLPSKVKANGTRVVTEMNLISDLRNLLSECLNIKKENWVENEKWFNYTITFPITINDIIVNVIFELFYVKEEIYLNISPDGNTNELCLKSLEYIMEKIYDKSIGIENNFIIVQSYDAISEYYCNMIYPKFAQFERLLRQLIYNIYILNYGKNYYKDFDEDLVNNAKGKIKAKKNNKEESYLKEFFYALDYHDLETLLFTPRWISITEIKNKSVTLSDIELREFVKNLNKKSDWDRFFETITPLSAIENIFKNIHKHRNIVAHNKFLSLIDYEECTDNLNQLIKIINEALEQTQNTEFHNKNSEYIQSTIKEMVETIKQTNVINKNNMSIISQQMNSTANKISEQISQIVKESICPIWP